MISELYLFWRVSLGALHDNNSDGGPSIVFCVEAVKFLSGTVSL